MLCQLYLINKGAVRKKEQNKRNQHKDILIPSESAVFFLREWGDWKDADGL